MNEQAEASRALQGKAKDLRGRLYAVSANMPDGSASWTEEDVRMLLRLAEAVGEEPAARARDARHGLLGVLRLNDTRYGADPAVKAEHIGYHEHARKALNALADTDYSLPPKRRENAVQRLGRWLSEVLR